MQQYMQGVGKPRVSAGARVCSEQDPKVDFHLGMIWGLIRGWQGQSCRYNQGADVVKRHDAEQGWWRRKMR